MSTMTYTIQPSSLHASPPSTDLTSVSVSLLSAFPVPPRHIPSGNTPTSTPMSPSFPSLPQHPPSSASSSSQHASTSSRHHMSPNPPPTRAPTDPLPPLPRTPSTISEREALAFVAREVTRAGRAIVSPPPSVNVDEFGAMRSRLSTASTATASTSASTSRKPSNGSSRGYKRTSTLSSPASPTSTTSHGIPSIHTTDASAPSSAALARRAHAWSLARAAAAANGEGSTDLGNGSASVGVSSGNAEGEDGVPAGTSASITSATSSTSRGTRGKVLNSNIVSSPSATTTTPSLKSSSSPSPPTRYTGSFSSSRFSSGSGSTASSEGVSLLPSLSRVPPTSFTTPSTSTLSSSSTPLSISNTLSKANVISKKTCTPGPGPGLSISQQLHRTLSQSRAKPLPPAPMSSSSRRTSASSQKHGRGQERITRGGSVTSNRDVEARSSRLAPSKSWDSKDPDDRSTSPDIDAIMSATPRPSRRLSTRSDASARSRSGSRAGSRRGSLNTHSGSALGMGISTSQNGTTPSFARSRSHQTLIQAVAAGSGRGLDHDTRYSRGSSASGSTSGSGSGSGSWRCSGAAGSAASGSRYFDEESVLEVEMSLVGGISNSSLRSNGRESSSTTELEEGDSVDYGVQVGRRAGAYDLSASTTTLPTSDIGNETEREALGEALLMGEQGIGLGLGIDLNSADEEVEFYAGEALEGFGGQPPTGVDQVGEVEESESDSDIDLHTPLPHILLREGVLSPHSKILSQITPNSGTRPSSVASNFTTATMASVMTKSGLYKDDRDTERRRTRHRDGRLLRGGFGLTTGLGWSDSEDEDAPSPLTHRLSSVGLSRRSVSSLHSKKSKSSLHVTRSQHLGAKSLLSKSRSSLSQSNPHPLSKSMSASSLTSLAGSGMRSHTLSIADPILGVSLSTGSSILPNAPKTAPIVPENGLAKQQAQTAKRPGHSRDGSKVINYSLPLSPELDGNRDVVIDEAKSDMGPPPPPSSFNFAGRPRVSSVSNGTPSLSVSIPDSAPHGTVAVQGISTARLSSSSASGSSGMGSSPIFSASTLSSVTSLSSGSGGLPFPATSRDSVVSSEEEAQKGGLGQRGRRGGSESGANSVGSVSSLRSKTPTSSAPTSFKSGIARPRSRSRTRIISASSAMSDASESKVPLPPVNTSTTIKPPTRPTTPSAKSVISDSRTRSGSTTLSTPRPLRLPALQQQSSYTNLSEVSTKSAPAATTKLQPGQPAPSSGAILGYNRNLHDRQRSSTLATPSRIGGVGQRAYGSLPSTLHPRSPRTSSPLPPSSPMLATSKEGDTPTGPVKPRTGTGMAYRQSSLPSASRMRTPGAGMGLVSRTVGAGPGLGNAVAL